MYLYLLVIPLFWVKYLGGLKGKDKLQIEFHKKFKSVMPPKNSKIAKACRAMKGFDISEVETKAALKQLLEVYEDNWDFIEADDYKELFNFIVPDKKKLDEEVYILYYFLCVIYAWLKQILLL